MLAAFRSKKSKTRKKSAAQCHSGHELAGDPKTSQHNIVSDSFIDSEKSSVETTPSDALSLSDSEPYSMTSDDEQLDEASRQDCSSTHIPFTISELENAMAEKKAVGDIFHIGDNSQRTDMSLVELALSQRDDLLSQLASSLKCIQELPIQTDDFTAQLCVLAQHICMLKTKLNQANQDLQEQLILHESSMISLQSAKAQILQLQKIILKKDEHIISLTRATQANNDIGQAMKLKDDTINQCQMMLQSQSAQLDTYRRELEAKTVECQRWAAAHEEWAVKEHQLMNELTAKSEELLKLEEALHVVKLEESELHQKYALLQATIAEKDSSDSSILRNLEHQLAELRATHESDSQEITRLQKINHDLEVDLTDHSKRLSLVDSLQQDYEHIMNQHSGCLQQIDNLNILNADIQQRLYSLGHTENDLHVLKEQFNNLSLNYQKEVQLRSELKKFLLNLTTNDKTSQNADDVVHRVPSPYHENLNTNNSSSSTEKEAITTAVGISVIQKDVIVSSSNEDVYMQQKSGESVCVPDLDDEKMHLLSLLEDLRSKLVNSDTVIQQYAEKISFLEKKNSSVKQMSKDEELKLLKTEIMSLTLKIQSQEADLSRATSELAESKESLLRLESKHSNSLDHTVHKSSEEEEVNLLQLVQHHKEIAELQSHLESTVAQWQKLQLIVQEKEIEIQNLQENLDEQKRICSNMHSAHQEYVEVLQSEIDTLKLKLEDYQEKFFNMENEILNLITEKNSIQNELKQAYEHNGNNGKDSVDVEIQTNTSATYNLVDAEIQTFPPEVLTQASSIDTEFSNVESQTSLNKEKDLVDVEMQTNTSATCSLLDAETQTTPTEVLTQTTSTDNEIQIYGDATLPQQTEAENQTHGFNQTKPSTSQAISKDLKMNVPEESLVEQATMIDKLRETLSHKDLIINNLQIAIVDKEAHVQELQGKVNDIENELFTVKLDYKEIVNNFQLSEENLERKTCEIAAERKKASSQQLKLKASKKQAAQKDEAIADLNRKLLEYQEQILDLNSQLVDRKRENSSLLSENDVPEETSLLQGSVQTPNWSEQLWDKTTEIARLHAVIEGKEETLLNVNTLLSESNDNVSMLVKTIDEKEEELKGIHKAFLDQQSELSTLNDIVNEKNGAINNLNQKVSEMQVDIDNLQAVITERDVQITDLENKLLEQENKVSYLLGRVHESEEIVKCLNGQLSVSQEEIDKLHHLVFDKEQEISDFNRKLSELQNFADENMKQFQIEREEKLMLCNQELRERSQEINSLKLVISEKEQNILLMMQSLETKELEVLSMSDKLKEQDVKMFDLNQVLAEKNEQVSQLQLHLSEPASELVEIRQRLGERDEDISKLHDIVAQRDEQLEKIHKILDEKSESVSELMVRISERDVMVSELQKDIMATDNEKSCLLEKLSEKENTNVNLQTLLSEKEAELSEFTKNQTEKDEEIQNLQRMLSEKEVELSKFTNKQTEKDEEFQNLQRVLSEKEAELSEFTKIQSEKDEEIQNLQRIISEKEVDLSESIKKQTYKDEEIQSLQRVLSEKEVELSEFTKIQSEKDEEIQNLQRIISEKEVDLSESIKKQTYKDEEIQSLQRVLSEKEVELSEFTKNQTEKDEEIQNLQRMLSEKEVELSEFTNKQTEKDEEFQNLQRVLSEKEAELSEFTKNQTEKDEEIQNLQRMLFEKEVEVSEFTNKQTEKDEEIQNLQRIICEKEVDLSESIKKQTNKDEEIQSLQRVLSEKEVELSEFTKNQTEKDEEFQNLQRMLSEKEVELSKFTNKQTEKDEEFQNLQRVLSEKEAELSEFTEIQSEKDEEIQNLQRIISEKEVDLSESIKKQTNKDEEIQNLQLRLSDKDKQLSEHEEEILKLNEAFRAKEEDCASLSQRLSDQAEEISKLNESVSNGKSRDFELNTFLYKKDEEISGLQEKMSEKDQQIVVLEEKMLNIEGENKNLMRKLEEKVEDLNQVHTKTNEIMDELVALRRQTTEKDLEMMDIRTKLEEVKKEISKLNDLLGEKEQHIVCLSERAEEQELALVILQNNAIDKNEEIIKLQSKLRDTTMKVNVLQKCLDNTMQEKSILQKNIESITEDNIKLQKEVENKDSSLIIAQTQLKSESEMNLESTKLLNTKDAEILKLKVTVSELVEDKANLHEQLAALNKDSGLLGQKEEEIKTMLTRLVEKDEELANVNQMILDKEKVISDMKEALDLKEEELSQSNRNLVLKNEEIVRLTQLVQEQTESCQVKISAAQQQLADNDSVTENYKIRLSELEVFHKETLEKLMQKEGQLDMVQSELETKKQEIQASNLKFEELISSNRDLSESIVNLNHKLETCLSNLYEKEAELCKAQHELSEKEMVIESTFLERDSLSEQLLQQKIILNELEDKVGSLESEISIQKLHRDDVVKEMEVKHIVVCDELKGLKLALQKKEAEYSIVEQDRDITKSKLLELETELQILKKELEDSNLEKQSSKENLLQNLTEMQQKIIQKDLEIAEITNKLSQEEENCRQLMSSNSNLQRNLIHLKSCLSNLSEKSEENQSVMIEQEVRLLEQERKIENLLANNVLGSSPEQVAYSSEDHSKIAAPEKKSDTIAVDILTRNDRYLHLMNQFIILRQDTEAKDQLLLEQNLQIEHQSINVSNLTEDLQKLQITLSESIQSNTSLKAETDALKAQCQSLTELEHTWKQRISSLETEVESLENISSHHVSECNRLAENVAQLSQERDLKEQQHIKVTHEAENYTKELNDIKVELEHKSVTESNLKETIVALTSSLDKSQEERELLKANFDSCMEDMQHKLAQQDLEIQSLRSKLAEQAKTVGQGQDQLKDMFELQICQLEEKLLLSEKQGELLAKELEDSKARFASSKDLFESQLSDLEISFQSSNSEAAKLRDQLSKIMINHECEIAGLKRLHDIQANELEDSCIALERNVSELKRQINDQTIKFNKERSNLEQSLEFQLSDNEEKRRIYETEISRLKRHLEEMKHDHEMELRNVEKSCEARMYELEDKCCIASNELERLRKSFIADGEYPEEQHRLDLRVDELETKRRDLEILNMSLEDEVRHLREQMAMREEELKSVLHIMAEKESERSTECAEEIISLRHQVSELSLEKKQILESLQKKKIDLEHVITKNKDLQLKIAELEQFVEEAVKSRKDWDNDGRTTLPSVEDLRSRINSLSEENSSLKRQLSVQEIPRRKLHLNSGVETICPPYSHASTEYSKSSVTDECFSPVVEPEVLEGFVAEKTISINGSSNTNTNSMINQEPDFVEEKNDRFQPEVESERFMDSSNQLNMHPIWENEIHEGFQPETSDLFLIESAEETTQRIAWPNELSVGMSPSHHQPDESQFDFNLTGEQGQTPHLNKTEEKLSASKEVDACDDGGNANEKMTVNEKQINQMMEDLEEQYVMKLRKQESDLQFKYEAQCEQFKKETEQHFAQKVQAVRYEWERKFTKALRKLKRDMDLRHREHTQELKGRASDQTDARLSSMPDIAERNEELGEVVEKLHKENQELAEVRDDLLRQIEMSRARGLRDRVQHELQTMLTTRDSHSLEVSRSRELHDRVLQELQTVMTPGDVHSLATVPTPCAISPPVSYEDGTLVKQSVDEAESSKSEGSDSSSVRESFLEELEEISHQSGQDLPLEWELTSTETGAFEQEPASIWEVFDGRCARQDCQEVDSLRIQYEHQVASLQRQLEAERRCDDEQLAQRQDDYAQAVLELRTKLDIELQDSLDQIIEELGQLHTLEMKQLMASQQDELSLELTALKLSMEQIYTTKAQLEATQQQELFQKQMEALEKRHEEELNRVKHDIVVPEVLEHFSETLTEDYNKLIQRISHELETKFVSDGDSGFGSHTSQELQSLLLNQQEEITMLRSKLLSEYGSLLQSRLETMTEHAEEVNKLEDQMKDIKNQCDHHMEHIQDSIKSQNEFEFKETDDHDRKYQESIDQLKEHYETVIEKMESEFTAKINALQDKYEEQLTSIVPFSTSLHTVLDSHAGKHHPISSRDNSVESGSFSESVEKDLSDQLKKLEADLLERDTAQQKLRNDLMNEQLRCETMVSEVSLLKQALDSLKAEHENIVSHSSDLELLLKEKEDLIVQLEKDKMESEKLYRDLLDTESKSAETKELSGAGDSLQDGVHSCTDFVQDTLLMANTNNSSYDCKNMSSSGHEDKVGRLEKLVEDLEHQLAAARDREEDLNKQMEEMEHAYQDTLESVKLELEHEKQVEIETLQSEFRVQLEVELKHQAAQLKSLCLENDDKEVLVADDSDQSLEEKLSLSINDIVTHVDTETLARSDQEKQNQENDGSLVAELKQQLEELDTEKSRLVSEHEEELRALQKQLSEAEDRYDHLMQGIEAGEHAELSKLFQDKYDKQLELAKCYIQKDFDEMLHEEKKSLVEKHRKLMIELMGDRSEEEKTMLENHQKELEQLRQSMNDQFQEERDKYTEEILRLNHELEEMQSSKSDRVESKHLTLPEINEIILNFQETTESTTSSLAGSRGDTSTPVQLNDSTDSLTALHMPEESAPLQQDDLNSSTDIPMRTFAEVLKSPPPLSTSERQEMINKIQQLRSQVESLTQQLADLQRNIPANDNSLSASNTLKEDDPALISMLKSDLDRISIERESIQRTNDRLLSLLSDSVKTYIGVEDTISRRLSQNSLFNNLVLDGTIAHSPRPGTLGVSQSRDSSPGTCRVEKEEDGDVSHDSHSIENTSFQSNGIDEGLEISQRLAECIFVGPDLDAEGEEILSDARGRLQTSISQLLELMERSCLQLQEAKSTQQDLLEALAARSREVDSLNNKCLELNSQISAEIEAKEYLGLELHKAEGLIAGYISEHDSLESQIQTLEQQRESMILELDTTRSRLEQFEQSRSELDSFREDLNHQQQVLQDNAGQEIQVDESRSVQDSGEGNPALLGEITSLTKDKRELANQLQQQLDLTHKRLLELETHSEELERQHDAALEEKLREIEDLRLQLESVERQLKASKSFVDEQISEREQEREEHQREIEKLQEILEAKERQLNAHQRLEIEIADLTEQLQSRMASQGAMHQHILDLQKALQDKELSAHDLKVWVAQLEKELDQKGDVEEQLKMKISRLEQQLTNKRDDSILDSAESSLRDTDKERTPPLFLSPVHTERQSSVSLEEELRRCQEFEQEMVHENKALKEQVQVQLLQISGLRNQLDELRQYSGMEADSDSSHLRIKLQAARDAVEKLEEKLSESQNRVESLENMLRIKTEESDQIRVKVTKILDMGDAVEENEHLKSQLEELQNQVSHLSSITSLSSLPPELLDEKNTEIQELKDKLTTLEKELSLSQEEVLLQKEKMCDLQARLKEKDEEINDLQDNIASIRRGEPFLDMSLPMNEEANNLLNISMTGRTCKTVTENEWASMHQEFEETILNKEAELCTLNEKLVQATQELDTKNQELENLKQTLSELQSDKDKLARLEEDVEHKDSELYSLTLNSEEMKQTIQEHIETIEILEQEIQKWEKQLSDVVEERDKLHSEMAEKDGKLDQFQIQIENYQQEIASLTNFQHELQKDFDTVQSMLEDKEKEVEALTQELTDNKGQAETLETLLHLERAVAALQKEVREKHNVIEEKEELICELQDKLEEMAENKKDELTKLKQQFTETQEELKIKQTALLDMQADREKLLSSQEELNSLQKNLEDKETMIEELESQLRLRQSRILDLEGELESLKEEMRKELKEKDEVIDRLENRIVTEEVTLAEDNPLVSTVHSNGLMDENNSALEDVSYHRAALSIREIEEKLVQSCQDLSERDKEIETLQAEIQSLQQGATDVQQLELKVKELQGLLQEQEETSQLQMTEHQKVIFKLQRELADLKAATESQPRQEARISRSAVFSSLSSSLDEEGQGAVGMTRWDSEPAGLAQGSRESIYLRLNMTEAARVTRQQQRELHQKNYELENLRQNLERWLKIKDECVSDIVVKEKETIIVNLRSEIETIRQEISEKEEMVTSLRAEIENLRTHHTEELAKRDHQITQLQEEIYLVKSVKTHTDSSKSHTDSSKQSLSPETKQSISHLKLQLRKAHAALEEMQGTRMMSEDVDEDSEDVAAQKVKLKLKVDKLREMLKSKEDEFTLFKTTVQIEQDEVLKRSLEEQKQRLEEHHKQELHELMLEYEEQMEVKEDKSDDEDKETDRKSTSESVTWTADDTMPERLQVLLMQLNELGEHFLSVSDLRYLQQYLSPLRLNQTAQADSVRIQNLQEFDETVEAMRKLFRSVEALVDSQATETSQDWRAEVLLALSDVYMKEKDLITAEIYEANASHSEMDILTKLETRLQHLADVHESSMDIMIQADRRSLVSELDNLKRELLETKLQLQNVKDELGHQVSHLEENKSKLEWKLQRQVQMLECKIQQEVVIQDDLKKSLKSERQRLSELTLQSTHDKSNLLELQSELSSAQIQLSKARDSLQREQHRFSSITMGWSETLDALEEEKAKNVRLSELLEATKKTLELLREEMSESDIERQKKSQSEDNYIQKLQEELLKERQRCYQFSQAEDEARRELSEVVNENTSLQKRLSNLQKELEVQQEKLHNEQMERESNSQMVLNLKEILASERDHHRIVLEKERTQSLDLKKEIETMKSQYQQLEISSDQTDGVNGFKSSDNEDRSAQLKLVETDRERLRVKVNNLEHELERIQSKMEELETELEQARRTRETLHHTQLHTVAHSNGAIYSTLANDNLEERLGECCSKLQSVAQQLDNMTLTSHQHKGVFVQNQNTLVSVVSQLKQLEGEIKERGTTISENGSSTEQVNRLLEHNQQLAEHVRQLKTEKKELVSSLQDIKTKMQDTRHKQMQLPQYLSDTASEDGGAVYDRTVWASERLGLQMALDSAEHEIQRLRTEIQQFRAKIHSDATHADVDKTSRLYGKYLRAESFRKALIYQKKYLLLLLGGYRDTEQETLIILASMGGFPHPLGSSYRRKRSKAFTTFRSAGRVIIAISRMKYMVRKWKRATRVGSPVMAGQIPSHISYVPSNSSYPKHKRHQPSYTEQPQASREVFSSEAYYKSSDDYLAANGATSSAPTRHHSFITTPPTRDLHRSSKPSGKERTKRDLFAVDKTLSSDRLQNGGHKVEDSDDFLLYLQNIHKQLSEGEFGSGRDLHTSNVMDHRSRGGLDKY
ncbi:A-kinase anchor protein 9-like isoform X4 [Biomphalaria glabrata]|uniref:A-kinase anchor protein 9-like isoform X4 n=1 Tax=Biomphalaria glabrata TaxID=6526 RepID=A0A9W2ZGV5_BIOGL|nr:A-kinase anchor protein 9-like isoform X4 [Biomphalaria glabrata]